MSSSEILKHEMAICWQWRIDTDPEFAAALGMLSQRTKDHALDPRSFASYDKRLEFLQDALERVKTFVNRAELLDESEKLSYDLYVKQLTNYCDCTPKYKAYLCCINRLEGPQTDLGLYARYLPLKTPGDRMFYLKFLQAIEVKIAEQISLLKLGLKERRTPSRPSLDGVVETIREMVKSGLSVFSEPIRGVFPDSEKDVEEKCHELIQNQVSLTFGSLADFLEQDYIPNLRTDTSASTGYPDGEAYYSACLEFHTTTSMTANEIHDLGLSEVKRVRSAMEAIAKEAGYDASRLDEYLEYLRTSKQYEPESAQAYLTEFRDITGRIAPALLQMFHWHTLPRMPFAVTEVPAAQAPTGPAAFYLAGSADPSAPRPGILYVNTSSLSSRRTYACESLALHESIPGHHTQGSIQAEKLELPEFRRFQEDRRYFEAPCRFPFYTGYIEGWALHCETLGEELGMYKTRETKMGQLSMEALRACRLVVDTGLHSKGWSQSQAVKYMLANTATGQHDAETEVARYITWPGQACAYKVGEQFIRKLRTRAETELGEDFDRRDFYGVVTECGPVPLDVLEQLVNEYIHATKRRLQGNGITALLHEGWLVVSP